LISQLTFVAVGQKDKIAPKLDEEAIKRRAEQSQQAIAQIQKNKVRMRIVGYKMYEGTFLK